MLVLSRLERTGPDTATGLAEAERVTVQSMAATVQELEEQDLVTRVRDTEDRRQKIVSLTEEGRRFNASVGQSREAWLIRAIEGCLDAEQQSSLAETLDILDQIVECDAP